MSGTLYLRCCAGCSEDLYFEHPGAGDWVYCRKCTARRAMEEVARPVVPGARCVHVDYQHGPFAQMYVTAVDGDRITTGILGWPVPDDELEAARREQAIARLQPAFLRGRTVFSRAELWMEGL